jgi:hypothetical protein
MTWKLETIGKPQKIKEPVLIVGLPGIANVGKIAADFIIDEVKAKKLYNAVSYDMPNSVFVNDNNLIELPAIEIYAKSRNGKGDLLILTGDVQPADESSSYKFCECILDEAQKLGVEKIITLGGIGLSEVPKKPQLFITGNSKDSIKEFSKGMKINEKLYGVVGPIIGVSGLLVGLAAKRKMPAVCILAETLGHPAYLGIKGAREVVSLLNKRLELKIQLKDLDREIEDIETEILQRTQELSKTSKKGSLKKLQDRMHKDTNYIG